MIDFDTIACLLRTRELFPSSADGRRQAAVALILRQDESGLSVLFVERSTHPGDPWSGDIGLPGGKLETTDPTPREAAERETREEIGLDLGTARCLGQLPDIVGAHLPIRVSSFVFGVGVVPSLCLSPEIGDVFWVPLDALFEPARHIAAPVRFRGEIMERPAIRLPSEGKPVLWGITYRLIMKFLHLLAPLHAER